MNQYSVLALCMAVSIFLIGCRQNTSGGIIAMSPALAECVWAIDPGPQHPLIAVNEYTQDVRADALVKLPRQVSVERIVAMHPEVVLLQRGDEILAEKLKKLHVNYLIFPMNTTEDVENALLVLGEKFKRQNNALNQIQFIRDKMDENAKIYNHGERKSALVIIDRMDAQLRSFYIAEPSSFIAKLADGCGFDVIQYRDNDSAWSHLDAEKLIDINPEYIIFLTYSPQDAREIDRLFRKIYSELDAVRNNRLIVYDDPSITVPSPNMGIRQERLCRSGAEILK